MTREREAASPAAGDASPLPVPPFTPPAFLVHAVSRGMRWLDRARRAITPAPVGLLEMTSIAFFSSSAIMAAVRLGVPQALRNGPLTSAALAATLGANERSLFRLMRVLVSIGLFDLTGGCYALNALSRQLLPEVPGSFAPLMRWAATDHCVDICGRLAESVRQGKPAAELVFGVPLFEYLAHHPSESEVFDAAIASASAHTAAAVLAAYDLAGVRSIVDVGGGLGQFLAFAVARYPQLRATLFELPHTVARAASHLHAAGCEDRVEVVAGDFFKSPLPSGADVYVLMNVVHDHGDEQALRILKNASEAVRAGGRVLVVEVVLPEDARPDYGKVFDLQMLLMFDGGKERTEAEFRALVAQAGLRITRIVATGSPSSILELVAA